MELNIEVIEKEVDEKFASIPMPHKIKDIAVWHVLTVLEDFLRMLHTRWVEKEPEEIEALTDESKYALRHCLDQIISGQLVDEHLPLPIRSNPESYVMAHTLFVGALEFARFSRLVGSVHAGRARIICEGDEYVMKYKMPFDPKYSALELLDQGQEIGFDISTLHYEALNGSREPNKVESAICDAARVKNRRVHYTYDPFLAYNLAQEIPQRPVLFPSDFVFPWGTANETLALINSLHVRCLYHLLAVHLTAKRLRLRGGAEDSLVLVLRESDLIKELSYLADVGDAKITNFIQHLTYGFKSKTPDPSLQPILRTQGGNLLLPCAHIITSNSQRNLLSLFARVSARDFDRQSKHFETKMTNELLLQMKEWTWKAVNKILQINGQKEEIDLIIADPDSRTLLLLELRWMIQPGDPREVANKYDACNAKVVQLNRKMAFVRDNIREAIGRMFPDQDLGIDFSDWQVRGIVVIQGFGGHVSSMPEIPVITAEILRLALNKFSSGRTLYEWAASLCWLPQEEVHFSIAWETAETRSHTIRRPGMFLKVNNSQYLNYVESTIVTATSEL